MTNNPTTITLTPEAANAIPAEALREFLEQHGCRAREWASGEIRVDVPPERPQHKGEEDA